MEALFQMKVRDIIKFFKDHNYEVEDKVSQLDFTHPDRPNTTISIHYAQFSQMTEKILNDFIKSSLKKDYTHFCTECYESDGNQLCEYDKNKLCDCKCHKKAK